MKIKASSGSEYYYNPINNYIDEVEVIDGEFNINFKPLEAVSTLPNIDSFTIGVTEQCNFRCSYCCYSGAYSEHRKHSLTRLTIDKIPLILDFILKYSSSKKISVDLYGGESLLEFQWIREFVKKAKDFDNISWSFEISTNGFLLKPDVVDWLVENEFKIFVSIDGIGRFHDECRKDMKGLPTYSTIEANLDFIRNHFPNYWDKNVYVMMTIHDITALPEIAKEWMDSPIFKNKAPYRISEVSTIYNGQSPKINELIETDKYLRLVEWYKGNPDNILMRAFFNIWLAEWIERPIGEIDYETEYPTCVPHNRKLFIDAKGYIGICERISDKIRFGNLQQGIDFTKLNEIRQHTADFIDRSCAKCEIARICDICPDILKISNSLKEIYCHNQKVSQSIKLRCFCELAEVDLI